jgi:hypothetical protein
LEEVPGSGDEIRELLPRWRGRLVEFDTEVSPRLGSEQQALEHRRTDVGETKRSGDVVAAGNLCPVRVHGRHCRRMFTCESSGYEAVVFGAFDGVTSWTNNAYINLGLRHQEMVSAHEERHLRLQKGTA